MSIPPHLVLISEVLPVQRRDFTLSDPTLLNPNNANPLYDGEWLELDSSYKLVRGASGEGALPAWQLFAERGRYDTQAIAKAPVLFIGGYEAETTIVTLAGLAVGSALSVTDVTVDAASKRGLALTGTGSGEHMIVGYVTRVLSDRVRFWKVEPQWKHHA
jgi:hypothetical protein